MGNQCLSRKMAAQISSPTQTTSNNTPGAPIKTGKGVPVENLNDPRELFPKTHPELHQPETPERGSKRTLGECWDNEPEVDVTESRTPSASPPRTPDAPPPKRARPERATGEPVPCGL